jgi:C1A family cysteine protease
MAKTSRPPLAPKEPMLRYGWVPDVPDNRDYQYAKIAAPPVKLPPKVDLRKLCSPVENQESLGSCTANALVGALEFLERKNKQPYTDLSRLFIYYNERVIEHTVKSDNGAMLRDGVKTLSKDGVCPESFWPYDISKYASKPTSQCYKEAALHKITQYNRILSLAQMRSCLAEGYPFVFGFSVYDAFESPKVAETGVLNMPKPGERMLGGHAVLAVGYDDKSSRFIVRNSWGVEWGKKGYFTMPYDYAANTNLADDFWTIR